MIIIRKLKFVNMIKFANVLNLFQNMDKMVNLDYFFITNYLLSILYYEFQRNAWYRHVLNLLICYHDLDVQNLHEILQHYLFSLLNIQHLMFHMIFSNFF